MPPSAFTGGRGLFLCPGRYRYGRVAVGCPPYDPYRCSNYVRGLSMHATIPPTHSSIAASLDWETATVGDLLDLSAASRISAGLLYRAVHQLARVHAERPRNVGDDRQPRLARPGDVALEGHAMHA